MPDRAGSSSAGSHQREWGFLDAWCMTAEPQEGAPHAARDPVVPTLHGATLVDIVQHARVTPACTVTGSTWLLRVAVRVPWGVVWAPAAIATSVGGGLFPRQPALPGKYDVWVDCAPGAPPHATMWDEYTGRVECVSWGRSVPSPEGRWWMAWTPSFSTLWAVAATPGSGSAPRLLHSSSPSPSLGPGPGLGPMPLLELKGTLLVADARAGADTGNGDAGSGKDNAAVVVGRSASPVPHPRPCFAPRALVHDDAASLDSGGGLGDGSGGGTEGGTEAGSGGGTEGGWTPPPLPRLRSRAAVFAAAGVPMDTPPRHAMSWGELDPLIARVRARASDAAEADELQWIFEANVLWVHTPEEAAYLAHALIVSDAERAAIAGQEQRGEAWKGHRGRRWTGSRFARVAGMGDYGVSIQRAVAEALWPRSMSSVAMQHGTHNEPRAYRSALAAQGAAAQQIREPAPHYLECGFVVDKYAPWFGASPDMLVLSRGAAGLHAGAPHAAALAAAAVPIASTSIPREVLSAGGGGMRAATHVALGELKCPYRGAFYEGGVSCKGDYLAQLHCNMQAMGLRTAVFSVFLTSGAQRVEHIAFDKEYWGALMASARATYFEEFLPRLVWKEEGRLRWGDCAPPPPTLSIDATALVYDSGEDGSPSAAAAPAFSLPTRRSGSAPAPAVGGRKRVAHTPPEEDAQSRSKQARATP